MTPIAPTSWTSCSARILGLSCRIARSGATFVCWLWRDCLGHSDNIGRLSVQDCHRVVRLTRSRRAAAFDLLFEKTPASGVAHKRFAALPSVGRPYQAPSGGGSIDTNSRRRLQVAVVQTMVVRAIRKDLTERLHFKARKDNQMVARPSKRNMSLCRKCVSVMIFEELTRPPKSWCATASQASRTIYVNRSAAELGYPSFA